MKATSITRADSEKSDGTVIVWENSSCVVKDVDDPPNCVSADDPQNRLLSATTDKFATDRNTGMAVNDRKYVSADAGGHKGLVNKFPFETKKQTYPYWDGTLRQARRTPSTRGRSRSAASRPTTSSWTSATSRCEISEGVQGTYSNKIDIYVEPLTGAILNQTQDMHPGHRRAASPFIALQLGFTDAQIKSSASDAEDNINLLNLLRHHPADHLADPGRAHTGAGDHALAPVAQRGLTAARRRSVTTDGPEAGAWAQAPA